MHRIGIFMKLTGPTMSSYPVFPNWVFEGKVAHDLILQHARSATVLEVLGDHTACAQPNTRAGKRECGVEG